MIRGRYVSEYITCEYGVAQVLESLSRQMDIDTPDRWGDHEEQTLIRTYLKLRETTSMTDSDKQSTSIKKQRDRGIVSAARHSFSQ